MQELEEKLKVILERIRKAEITFHRPDHTVKLIGASKLQPSTAIRTLYKYGQKAYGESYLQEAQDKIARLKDLDLEWHFIGTIQSNKTKEISSLFSWVHSVDRFKIAHRLNQQRPPSLPPLNICIQVNLHNEPSKAGLLSNQLPEVAKQIADLSNLKLRGLMAIPAPQANFQAQSLAFQQLAELKDQLAAEGLSMDTLSMGMSADLEAAIAAGSTMVRVGTDLFGPRPAHIRETTE